jgi:formylglycine-generating enzyme required for sulfatase activity
MGGGVAEWVRSDEGGVVRGGSFRSQLATQLRTWRREKRDAERGYDDVGLRCAYE